MRVLVACEFSGVVREAFRGKGHDVWSCDILPADDQSPFHLQCDVLSVLDDGWDMMIAHPPCTYLLRSGWHWVNRPDSSTHPLKGNPRREAAKEAAQFFMKLLDAPIERKAVENPVPICHVNLPPYDQLIQPWMFGHGEKKATCLWLRKLPPLQPTHRRDDLFCKQEPVEREGRIHKMPPSKERSKLRSIFFPGIADAMAEQWS